MKFSFWVTLWLRAIAGVVAWWLSDRVTNRYYMISDFSQVEVFNILFQNNIGILSFIFTIRAFHLRILYWRRRYMVFNWDVN